MAALARAEVAHKLRGLAEEHFDGDWSEVAATICNEAFDRALADARAAYGKAVGNGKTVRS